MLNLKYNPDPVQDPIRVAIYARVSSDAQDINNSIEAQIAECEQYARDHNMVVVAVYIDEAESGRSDNRTNFQLMVADGTGKDKPFEVILVWKFSRFSRSRVDNAIYKNRLKRRGARIVSIKEPTDDSPAGQFMESVIEDVDAFYSANLSQEVRRGQRQVAERGYYPGNKAPDGYKLEKVQEEGGNAFHNIFVIDPIRAPIIRRIFDEAIAGQSENDIRKGLDADGIPPPEPMNRKNAKSVRWSNKTIHDDLHNLHYAGFIVWGASSKSGDPPVIAQGRHTPIVSPEEFERAGQVLASKAPTVTHPRQAGSVYMMSKLLVCRRCNKPLNVRPSKNQTSKYFQCPTRRDDGVEVCDCPNLNILEFDNKFLAALLDDILCPSNIEAAIAMMAEELSGPYEEQNARLLAIESELLDVSKRQARVMEAYEKGAYDVEDYTRRITPLRETEADLKQRLADGSREIEHQTAVLANPREILEFTGQIADFIRHSEPKERKQMLRRFIKCVWIEPGKGTIVYRIPLPKDAKRPEATELVLDLDDPVPPIARLTPAVVLVAQRRQLRNQLGVPGDADATVAEPAGQRLVPFGAQVEARPVAAGLLRHVDAPGRHALLSQPVGQARADADGVHVHQVGPVFPHRHHHLARRRHRVDARKRPYRHHGIAPPHQYHRPVAPKPRHVHPDDHAAM